MPLSLRALFLVTLLILLVTLPSRALERFEGRVVHVADGDTVTVLTADRQQFKIRLHGIDCPESSQPYGQAAKRYTLDLAAGRDVTVVPVDTDRYGRIVADVILPDGQSLTRALIWAGYAWWYERYAPGNTDLAALQDDARTARRGLWQDPAPIPPWDFRKISKRQKGA